MMTLKQFLSVGGVLLVGVFVNFNWSSRATLDSKLEVDNCSGSLGKMQKQLRDALKKIGELTAENQKLMTELYEVQKHMRNVKGEGNESVPSLPCPLCDKEAYDRGETIENQTHAINTSSLQMHQEGRVVGCTTGQFQKDKFAEREIEDGVITKDRTGTLLKTIEGIFLKISASSGVNAPCRIKIDDATQAASDVLEEWGQKRRVECFNPDFTGVKLTTPGVITFAEFMRQFDAPPAAGDSDTCLNVLLNKWNADWKAAYRRQQGWIDTLYTHWSKMIGYLKAKEVSIAEEEYIENHFQYFKALRHGKYVALQGVGADARGMYLMFKSAVEELMGKARIKKESTADATLTKAEKAWVFNKIIKADLAGTYSDLAKAQVKNKFVNRDGRIFPEIDKVDPI
eukprot:gnl/MRDRNA2_/MRDRNA2_27844_c0_seq1.p1 gnl/MRDRNA2_/MRDRNA2_27844_c0~~gnl/MRDRNA2_/MRDRNA2_27844_c0_seq1.p1  ORF type:complete len:399 (-),score=75.82 gnl/MRDRNA2_/MRDRNA2_27844_c0_seq1:103-1299(-)